MENISKTHPVRPAFAIIGALIALAGLVNDAYDLVNLGVPNMAWVATGALFFFVTVFSMVHQMHGRLEGVEKTNADHKSGLDPASIPGKIAQGDQFIGCTARLQEILTGYYDRADLIGSLDEAGQRYDMINLSDSSIWADKALRQARRDFLNRCGVAMHYLRAGWPSTEDEEKVKEEVMETGDKLIEILKEGA